MDSRHGAGVCTLSNRARQFAGSKFLHDDDQRAHPRMVHVEQEELFVNLVNKKWVVEAEHRGPDINNFEHETTSLKPISIYMLYLEGMLASKLRPELMLRNSHAAARIAIWLLLLLSSRRGHGFWLLFRFWRWLSCVLLSVFVALHPEQF